MVMETILQLVLEHAVRTLSSSSSIGTT
jgi:hypothetical protein